MADGIITSLVRLLTGRDGGSRAATSPATRAAATAGSTAAARARGGRRLARRLDNELPDAAIALHDRNVPNTRGIIDHLAITPSGIWLIDTKRYAGSVERRTVGAPWARRARLYLDGVDQTALADDMSWQTVAVRAHLDTIDLDEIPIRPVLCFAGSNWRRHQPPFVIGDALVTSPGALVDALSIDGPISGDTIARLASHLALAIPTASRTGSARCRRR